MTINVSEISDGIKVPLDRLNEDTDLKIKIMLQNSFGLSQESNEFNARILFSRTEMTPDSPISTILSVTLSVILLLFLIVIALRK